MPDLGAKYTDDQIIQMEKQLKSVYNQAYKDILQKQKDFNKKYEEKEAKYKEKVAKGQMSQEEFDSWKKGQVFQGEQWQNKKKDILNTIYNSNKIATDIVNGKTQNVFTFNANYMSYELEHGAGVNFGFSLYDSATVVNLIKNDPQLLPEWKINKAKDYTWNQKKLNRQISLGIIEGESLDKIATRFSDSLATQNFNKMRTFARTAMTGAQNSGRQTTFENAKDLGIKLKKEWMATLDNHTRINHILLDGQKVNTDDDFEVDGLKIRYPGDPQAVPAMTYNCRCTMVGDIEDYPAIYDRYDNIDGKPIKNMTYTEWEAAKSKGEDISPVPLTFSHVEKEKVPDKEWVEKSIDKDKFIENAKNAEGARDKTIKAIMETPENYRKCFTNTLKNVNFFDDNGKAFYRNNSKSISINFDKILSRDNSLGTLFHENGHAMDYAYMYARNPKKSIWRFEDKDRTSQLPNFLSAIEKDLDYISKNIDKLDYHKDVQSDGSKGVQDFFSALKPLNDKGPRKGKIPENLLSVRYRWSHSYDYYTRKSDPMVDAASELFANISGGYGDPNQMKYMEKYFPNAVKEFGLIIDDMAKTIKIK